MLRLPTITLLGAETRAHELAARAICDALTKIEPGEVVIWTDNPERCRVPGATYYHVDDIQGSREWWWWVTNKTFGAVKTSHALFMEWDTGIVRPDLWTDRFLQYDFIGAPWWYTDGLNVGNGGFSIRSKRLADFTAQNGNICSDNNLCRDYRRQFEAAGGFQWAPDDIAGLFSREQLRPVGRDAFGFHDARNWFTELDRAEIIERFGLMMDIIKRDPRLGPHYHWETLLMQMPWLANEVTIADSCKNWKAPS